MRGTIGIPRSDHQLVNWHTMMSIIDATQLVDFKVVSHHGSIIEVNRNEIASRVEGDWLLFIDTDMYFQDSDILNLVEEFESQTKYDILSGFYRMGYGEHLPVIYKRTTNNPLIYGYKPIKDLQVSSGTIEVDACGMGFAIISTKALKAVGPLPFAPIRGYQGVLGEDISFCQKAKDKGFKIGCVTDIKIGHIRPYSINADGSVTPLP